MELTVKPFDALSAEELYRLLQLRVSVFVVEQQCPYQELDGKDLFSYHVYLSQEGSIQAYVRVVPPTDAAMHVSIGRVLSAERGSGLGRDIMLAGIEVAKEKLGADTIRIEAQSYAKGFYERLGFQQISEEFLEDGIPHINMQMTV